MIKQIASLLFAVFFYFFRLCPINEKKVTFVQTFDDHMNGNLKAIYENLKNSDYDLKYNIITRMDYSFPQKSTFRDVCGYLRKVFRFYVSKNYHLATSKYVILNNIFVTGAYLKFHKKTLVIQVWHATGTFKKFGLDYNPSKLLNKLQKKASKIHTHVVVNSKNDIDIYSTAFQIPKEKIYALGSPSTDFFFDSEKIKLVSQKILDKYPQCINKKIILYAPTYRETKEGNNIIIHSIMRMQEQLDREYILLIKLHPHIKSLYGCLIQGENIIDVSNHEDVNELMTVSELLITDYSSIIYEFALLSKPIVFFSPDLEQYTNSRGFYHQYEDFIPGSLVCDVDTLLEYIHQGKYINKSDEFVQKWYDHLDGRSTQRFIDYFFADHTISAHESDK